MATSPQADRRDLRLSPDQRLLDWIKQEEGFRGKPYQDSEGYTTIGYGRNLDANPLSREEADFLLAIDLKRAVQAVASLGEWTAALDSVRWCGLVALAFQLGETGLKRFKRTLWALERGDYAAAGAHLLDSRFAKQVPGRARRVAQMFATGEWSLT